MLEALRPLQSDELGFLRDVYPGESDEQLTARVQAVHTAVSAGLGATHLYKCVREVMYISPRVARLPGYAAALALHTDSSGLWVDVGAGPGTDLRKVVASGWPAARTAAIDITPDLWPLGTALFGAAPCALTVCDVAATLPPPELRARAAVLSLVSVLHTMSQSTIPAFLGGLRALLQPGGLVLGSTAGATEPRQWTFANAAGSPTRWLHSAESLAALLASVGLVGIEVTAHEINSGSAGVAGGLGGAPLQEPWQRMLAFSAKEPA